MPRKRQVSTSGSQAAPKRAKPTRSTRTTSTKSNYFSDEPKNNVAEVNNSSESDNVSDFQDEESPSSQSEDDEEAQSDFDDDSDAPGKQSRSRRTPKSGKSSAKATPGSISKISASSARKSGKTGLGPGTEVVMKKPRARDSGGTPYTDDTIHPNTLAFLKDLAANNDREWLKMNDPDYRVSLNDWHTMVEALTQRIPEVDETIPELPVKDLVFRIYRDVRFSNNKTPYKTAFSAAWSRTGRKGPYAVYYIHIQPGGKSLVAGGLWMPEASTLAKLRREIDRRSSRMKAVLADADFRKEFLEGVANDKAKVVDRFVKANKENALKTKPKGFDPDHQDIDLLRLRNFTVRQKLKDADVIGRAGLERIVHLIACLVPFITYLNSVVMPDDPSDGESGADGDDISEDENTSGETSADDDDEDDEEDEE